MQRYLVLPIPGSGVNARNAPGARPYFNRQPLKKISRVERAAKISTRIIFNVKTSRPIQPI